MEKFMHLELASQLHQKLAMTPAIRQAIAILQMPQIELASYLEEEVEKNPLLEIALPTRPNYDVSLIAKPPTLYETLTRQIREHFINPEDIKTALQLLEELDERGFLPESTPNSPVLSILQTFDPPGIFARGLQECLLLQLDPSSPTFHLVHSHFEKLLRGHLKGMGSCFQELSRLTLQPASLFNSDITIPRLTDLYITKQGDRWIVSFNDEELPKIQLRPDLDNIKLDSKEEKELFRNWTSQGKWLLRSLQKRKELLLKIGVHVVQKQAAFLDHAGPLAFLCLQDLTHELHLHESTLSRAIMGKHVSTPRGIISLRSLFTSSPIAETAKHILKQLIANEDLPMSDTQIAKKLQNYGMKLSRRTIAKYRKQLEIAPISRRKLTKN